MLTGCEDGKDGTVIKSGESYTEFTDAKIGDFFIDTNDYILYTKTALGWEIVMENYGRPGTDGEKGEMGEQGSKGDAGATGVGIKSVEKTGTSDLVDTYTITYTDGTTSTFTVTNGAKGDKGDDGDDGEPGATGNGIASIAVDETNTDTSKTVLKITFTNNSTQLINVANGKNGENGVGITSISKTSTNGLIDTYTITYSSGDSTTFTVTNGKDGATWHSGKGEPTADVGAVGDFYLDETNLDIYKKSGDGWTKLANIKGEKGEDGISVYMGYDGYIWQGSTKTKYKAEVDESTTDASVWEDTIAVADETAMGKYFEHEYVDTASNYIALMQHYKSNAQMTIYGNSEITEIQIVSENAGTLNIGTAKVADVKTARENGTALIATTTSYDVKAGVNTITLTTPLVVAEDETLVLGGSGSTAKLYVAKGIPTNDEVGNFSLINGQENSTTISTTGDYADTLAIEVKAIAYGEGGVPVFENFATEYTSQNVSTGVYVDYTPFKYVSSYDSNFSGKTITKIGAFCEGNNAGSGNQPYMTIYKIKTSTTNYFATNAIETIKIYFPEDSSAGQLVYADCNIVLAKDETIAFGKSDDTFVWRFKGVKDDSGNLWNNDGTAGKSASLAFDIYVNGTVEVDFSTHLTTLNEKEKYDALKSVLSGKNLSILGDSISTFDGYSNDSTNTNSTIGSNYVSYGTTGSGKDLTLSSVDDTWWKQTADMTGMNVLVNNSYGGSKVSDTDDTKNAITRAQNLHDDTGDNKDTNPDIIAVYMGINDFIGGVSSADFETAYDKMIAQIRTTYGKDVKIFVFTLVTYGTTGDDNATLLAYNTAIKTIASKYNCEVVDYANSIINSGNLSTYMQDASLLHPNAQGMDVITDCFWNALYETYITNA